MNSVTWPYASQPMKVIATIQNTGLVISRIVRIIAGRLRRRTGGKGHKSKNHNVKTQATGRVSD